MTIEYVIRFNAAVKESLTPFFAMRHLWDVRPLEAVRHSAAAGGGCDAGRSSHDVKALAPREYLAILVSALPRHAQYGDIVGFSRAYFAQLAARGDHDSLIDITNYVFKNLGLSESDLAPLLQERTLRLAHDLHYWANTQLHALRSKHPQYRQLPTALDQTFAAVSFDAASFDGQTNNVVFIFLTANYLANLEYWLDLYLRHDPEGERLLVLAIGDGFDEPVEGWLAGRGAVRARVVNFIPPLKLGVCGNGLNLDFLWFVKVYVTKLLLDRGLSVVYSDLDAYWIKNYFTVRALVNDAVGADLIVSMTHDMPRYAVQTEGFTPCAGFFSAVPTAGGKALLADWCRMTEVMFDDQIALAELLYRHGAAWQPERSPTVGATLDLVNRAGVSSRIAVLPTRVARRVGLPDPATIEGATIWHPRWVMAPDQHGQAIQLIANADD